MGTKDKPTGCTCRGPYDTWRYSEDIPDRNMVNVVADCIQTGAKIILLSGRNEDHREVTEAWLQKHIFGRHTEWKLFMRPSDQPGTNDAIIKSQLVDKYVSNQYNVILHYDDRNRVVDALRAKGMKVAQVNPGDF